MYGRFMAKPQQQASSIAQIKELESKRLIDLCIAFMSAETITEMANNLGIMSGTLVIFCCRINPECLKDSFQINEIFNKTKEVIKACYTKSKTPGNEWLLNQTFKLHFLMIDNMTPQNMRLICGSRASKEAVSYLFNLPDDVTFDKELNKQMSLEISCTWYSYFREHYDKQYYTKDEENKKFGIIREEKAKASQVNKVIDLTTPILLEETLATKQPNEGKIVAQIKELESKRLIDLYNDFISANYVTVLTKSLGMTNSTFMIFCFRIYPECLAGSTNCVDIFNKTKNFVVESYSRAHLTANVSSLNQPLATYYLRINSITPQNMRLICESQATKAAVYYLFNLQLDITAVDDELCEQMSLVLPHDNNWYYYFKNNYTNIPIYKKNEENKTFAAIREERVKAFLPNNVVDLTTPSSLSNEILDINVIENEAYTTQPSVIDLTTPLLSENEILNTNQPNALTAQDETPTDIVDFSELEKFLNSNEFDVINDIDSDNHNDIKRLRR